MKILDAATGAELDRISRRSYGLAVDEVGQRLFVSDRVDQRIYAYSFDGVFLYSFGGSGAANAREIQPHLGHGCRGRRAVRHRR